MRKLNLLFNKPFIRHISHSLSLGISTIIVVFIILTSLPSEVSASGDTYTVNTESDTIDSNLSDSLCMDSTGKCSLRAAIMQNNYSGGNTIIIPAGTYTLTLAGVSENGAATGDLDITKAVTITGSGGNRDGDASLTVIRAGTSTSNGIDRVFDINPALGNIGNVTLEALTISYGRATSMTDGYGGGGIAADSGTGIIKIYNSIIDANSAPNNGYGGGLYLSGPANGSIILEKTVIQNNATVDRGGGIYLEGDVAFTLLNSTVDNNSINAASNNGLGAGVAILSATASGGSVKINGSTISRNAATNGFGGGVYLNSAASILNTTISGNSSTYDGGGLLTSFFGGSVALTNVTVFGNIVSSSGSGGGIYLEAGLPILNNTIVAGNTKSGAANDIQANTSLSLLNSTSTHNLIGTGGSAGLSNSNGNQVNVSDHGISTTLAFNGGTTKTHALMGGSPALNAGDNSLITTALFGATPYDQRGPGYPRILNTTVDIGAVEQFLSSNAVLNNLVISSGTISPSFASATLTGYSASVANGVSSITVTPTLADANASVKTRVNSGTYGSGALALNVGDNVVEVKVTAEDGTTEKIYSVTVRRLNNNANLGTLSLSSGTLSPVFSSGIYTGYTASVANNVPNITLTVTKTDTKATVQARVNGGTYGAIGGALALNVGNNTVEVKVTAEDGTTEQIYNLTVRRLNNNANLSMLGLSSGTLSPSFAAGTYTGYTASVANNVTSLTVVPVLADANATVQARVNSGTFGSGALALNVGDNVVEVKVTAEDGTTEKIYSVTVRRLNNNANLGTLSLSSGTLSPVFSSGIYTGYTASVANNMLNITLTATKADTNASVQARVNGGTYGAIGGTLSLNVGNNIVEVKVTAEDGESEKIYVLTVKRISNNANLSTLSLSSGTLSPVFAAGTYTGYTSNVANNVSSIIVTAAVADANAKVLASVNGGAFGAVSGALTLDVGNNTVEVKVTAEDGTTEKIYVITVRRLNNNANLSTLSLSSGTLSPVFSSGKYTGYKASVANNVLNITLTATKADTNASVQARVNGGAYGAVSGVLALDIGDNTVQVKVTAEDGSTENIYSLTVRRLNNNADLSTLSLSSGTLSPVFAAGIYTGYTASVANNVSSIIVTAAVADANAKALASANGGAFGAVSGPLTLDVGNNTVEVKVTAEDGITEKIYVITVRRLNNNANLSTMTLSSGNLNPEFAADKYTGYVVSVANDVSSIKVIPTLADTNANVQARVNGGTFGAVSGALALDVGDNVVEVQVTAEDGTTKQIYVLAVKRISNNANLGTLSLSSGTLSPVFAAGTYTGYSASVANNVSSISVTAIVADANASVLTSVNGGAFGAVSAALALNVGDNLVEVKVTAEDGTTEKVYVITVRRLNNNTNLSALSLSSGILNPNFESGMYTGYKASVANNISSITVTPALADANASVQARVNGGEFGAVSEALTLNLGDNTVDVKVISEDGASEKLYAIIVRRLNNAASLNTLSLSSGILSPSFAIETYTGYTASVANNISSITVIPVLTDTNASVQASVNGGAFGAVSGALTLNVGDNTVEVKVTAEDGTTVKTYEVTVKRLSNNANLSMISLSSGTLTPSFAAGTTSYTVTVTNYVTNMKVIPTVSDTGIATVTVNGVPTSSGSMSDVINLTVGNNLVTVVVTAQDGTTKAYTITIVVQNAELELKNQLMALDTEHDGIHISEIIQWIRTQSRDIDGDGIFDDNDIALLLRLIESIND